ncbi:adenylyl-sulfate kinase [Vibrio paucivorans]
MNVPYERKENESVSDDVVWHNTTVTHQDRIQLKKQQPVILWFTGLSGSGKSTVANAVESKLLSLGKHSYLLDGDNVRHGLNKDLGFSDADRVENIRRIGEVAKLFVDSGAIVLTAFISPFISDRQQVRDLLDDSQFLEVFIDTPIEVCESRDPKGLYKKARAGEIKNFTGIDSEYQAPVNPEIHVKTADCTVEECAELVVRTLQDKEYI